LKYSKFSALASLIFTIVPLISALISNYVTLPYKSIIAIFFIIAWYILAHFVITMPNKILNRLNLTKSREINIQKYWIIEYEQNSAMACSVLEIRDDCDASTDSKLRDYKKDLSEMLELGISCFLPDDTNIHLGLVCAKGQTHHSFIRTEYRRNGCYEVIRTDENNPATPSGFQGTCKEITKKLLRESGVCEDERIGQKLLDKFMLTPENIEHLLIYMYKNRNDVFAREVIKDYYARITQLSQSPSLSPSSPNPSIPETVSKTQKGVVEKAQKGEGE